MWNLDGVIIVMLGFWLQAGLSESLELSIQCFAHWNKDRHIIAPHPHYVHSNPPKAENKEKKKPAKEKEDVIVSHLLNRN